MIVNQRTQILSIDKLCILGIWITVSISIDTGLLKTGFLIFILDYGYFIHYLLGCKLFSREIIFNHYMALLINPAFWLIIIAVKKRMTSRLWPEFFRCCHCCDLNGLKCWNSLPCQQRFNQVLIKRWMTRSILQVNSITQNFVKDENAFFKIRDPLVI